MNKRKSWSEDAPKLVKMKKEGKSLKEMMKAFPHRSERAITNKLSKLGWSVEGL